MAKSAALEKGTLHFKVEARLLRELGERLVKAPDVALLELIKNAYDADATTCRVTSTRKEIRVEDDGHGMTIDDFRSAWMNIGTNRKQGDHASPRFRRATTGEKGIGRFSVRFLGERLTIRTVAEDDSRGGKTVLEATFRWPEIDSTTELGDVEVPYTLRSAESGDTQGTLLIISELRQVVDDRVSRQVRTGALGVSSPLASLVHGDDAALVRAKGRRDPGFRVTIGESDDDRADDVAAKVLVAAPLRAELIVAGTRLELSVWERDAKKPALAITQRLERNDTGSLRADLRFFPRRKGTFRNIEVNGTVAGKWVSDNSGVSISDRGFRIAPYGDQNDDWLRLAADYSRRQRHPQSSLSKRHFPMDETTARSTADNYMLRLPGPTQIIGVVQVASAKDTGSRRSGLVPAADREGFVKNDAYNDLFDWVRGAVEAIAYVDRELQRQQKLKEEKAALREMRAEFRRAIRDVRASKTIPKADKTRLIDQLTTTAKRADEYEEIAKENAERLEVLSLLGVVSAFMTHEFGVAINAIKDAEKVLKRHSRTDDAISESLKSLGQSSQALEEFGQYVRGYVSGTRQTVGAPYPAAPRVRQVIRIFGRYAEERGVEIETDIERSVVAPQVPPSLYNGIALNLFTNALKAVINRAGAGRRVIAFRAWNDNGTHVLQVSDTGTGIPKGIKARIFEPFFTTTTERGGALESGMGLGLPLVRRVVSSFGGTVEVVDPPPKFMTCFEVRLPLKGESSS